MTQKRRASEAATWSLSRRPRRVARASWRKTPTKATVTSKMHNYCARQPPCLTHIRERAQFMLLAGDVVNTGCSVVAAVVRESPQSVPDRRFHHLQFLPQALILGLLRLQFLLQLIDLRLQSGDCLLGSVTNRLQLCSQRRGSRSFSVALLNSFPVAILKVDNLHLQRSCVVVNKRWGLPRLRRALSPLVRQTSHCRQTNLKPPSSTITFQSWREVPSTCSSQLCIGPWRCRIHQILAKSFLQLVRTIREGPHAARSPHIQSSGRSVGCPIRLCI
mmetsp:Transcript_67078/g.178938  ORF Transcript_67078/g.178938 Transcript_67078/m.178938 type:complete len:275 (-) Transcript_67078:643-1467(-)